MVTSDDFYFINTDGKPLDKIHVNGPDGVKTLLAEDGYNKAVLRESNLTEGEVEVLSLVKRYSGPGMAKKIAGELGKRRSWVSYILARLCDSGHVKRLRRGIYYSK